MAGEKKLYDMEKLMTMAAVSVSSTTQEKEVI
jgi:hypothetical protein